jgi:hypothetical protein
MNSSQPERPDRIQEMTLLAFENGWRSEDEISAAC